MKRGSGRGPKSRATPTLFPPAVDAAGCEEEEEAEPTPTQDRERNSGGVGNDGKKNLCFFRSLFFLIIWVTGICQNWNLSEFIFTQSSDKLQFWQIPTLTNSNSDKLQYWVEMNSDKFHFWQIPILTNSNSDKFQFLQKVAKNGFWQIPILTNSVLPVIYYKNIYYKHLDSQCQKHYSL